MRVKLVKDIDTLESFPYCGHGVILGKISYGWQDCQSVLAQFGSRQGQARDAYRRFVEEGVALGRRPELVGGGLVRSAGGWAEVRSRRQRREPQISDDRILGSAEFVERVWSEAEKRMILQPAMRRQPGRIERIIATTCKKENRLRSYGAGAGAANCPQ